MRKHSKLFAVLAFGATLLLASCHFDEIPTTVPTTPKPTEVPQTTNPTQPNPTVPTTGPVNEHEYVWVDEVPATCDENGVKGHYTRDDGKYFDAEYNEITDLVIPALGHEFDLVIVWDGEIPTSFKLVCSNDPSHEITKEELLTNGTIEVSRNVLLDPTCDAVGYVNFRIDITYNGKQYYAVSDQIEVPKLEHAWKWVVDKEPTETEDGIQHEECEICGEKRNENTIIPHIHTHEFNHVEAVAATCETAGHKEYYNCNICGHSYEDSEGTKLIPNLETWLAEGGDGYIAPLGHDYELVVEWNGLDSTYSLVCKNDRSHVIAQADLEGSVVADEGQYVPATCEEEGEICYIVNVTYNGKSYRAVSELITLPKLAHEFTLIPALDPTAEKAGHKEYYVCSLCNKAFASKNEESLIEDLEAWLAEGGEGYLAPKGLVDTKTTTYTFNNKEFADVTNSWKGEGATGFESTDLARGVQASGKANLKVESVGQYNGVVKVVVVASTNGTTEFDLYVSVGDVTLTKKVSKGNNQDVEFEFEKVDGVITVETKNNSKSVWIKSVQVEYSKVVTPEHKHEYTYSVVWEEEKAYLVATCSKCEEGTEGHEVKTELQVTEVVTPATCEEAGSRVLTATLPEGVENNNYELVKTIVIPAKGHNYDLDGMTWSWANDNSETKLLIACKDCDHVEVIEGVITKSAVTDEANNLIITTLTAKATFNGVEYTDVKTISVPAHTHVFEFVGFRWNEDKTKAYAVERCNVDECTEERLTEVEAIKNDVKSAEFAATCEQAGKDIYDVTFDGHNGELEKVTEALGHSFGEEIAEVPATCDKEGVKAHYECSICHELFVKNEQGEFVKVTAEELAIAKLPHGTPVDVESKVSVDFSTLDYKNGTEVTSVKLGEDTIITFEKGSNKSEPAYYTKGTAIRCYGGNAFTISSERAIKTIKFVFSSGEGSNDIISNVGTFAKDTWTGSAPDVVFTIGGTSGHRRIKGLTVEFEGESGVTYVLEHVAAKESTCLEQGNTEYWYCPNCGAKFADAEGKTEITDVLLPLAPHKFDEPTYKWEDGKCTATRECTVCGHVETETVEGVSTLVSAATCTENEKYKLVATFENSAFEQQESKVFEKENSALGHDFAEPTYAWNGVECTATRVCKHDETHVETETVKGVYTLVSAATCTENETYKLVATFKNSAFEQQESEVFEKENTALGHEYMVLWGWAGDYSFATATFTCMNDATHTVELNATIEKEKVDATCTSTGLITYTATVELDGIKYTDEQYVEIPMAEHELELRATWDNGVATYELVCKNCNYVVDQSEYTSKITHTDDTATCHATGEITYTLVVTYAGKEYTSSSTVTTPMLEHNWVWVIDKEPTNDEDGIKHEECTLCGDVRNEGTPIHKLHDHVMTLVEQVEPTCEVAGHKAYYQCTECNQYYEDEEGKLLIEDISAWLADGGKGYIAPLGHDYEITYTWAEDYSTVTAKAVCKHDSTHVIEETVETVVETIVPECEGGLVGYTATFTNEVFEEQTKEVDIPATGHNYVFKEIQLVEGKFVEVLVCSRCGDVKHVETTNVVASVAKDDVVYGFTTLKDAYDFAEENATIVLVSDVALNEKFAITKAITLDLNGQTIRPIVDKNNKFDAFNITSKLTVKNGSIVRKLETPVHDGNLFVVNATGELHVDELTVDSNVSNFVLANLGSVVEILNSNIKSETYAVSTNASGVVPYGAPDKIIIKDSRLEVYPYAGSTGDCSTLLINTPTTVVVEGSTLIGDRHVVINRCGTITIKDSVLNNTCDFPDANKYLDSNWKAGNEVPTAYLVVGNRSAKAYEYPANCTLDGVDFVGDDKFPYIYTYGNTEVNNATLTITNGIKVNDEESKLVNVSFNAYTTLVLGDLRIVFPLTFVEAKDSTCAEAGNVAYYLCAETGDKFEDKNGLVKLDDVVIPALDHTFGEVTYSWNGDECTATRKCSECGHIETETVKAVYTVVTAATCTENEIYKLVATFKNEAFVQQESEVFVKENSALDHDFETATKLDYHFENGKLVVLEKECSRCGEKVYVDAEIINATDAANDEYKNKNIFVIGKVSKIEKASNNKYNDNIYLNNDVFELYSPKKEIKCNVGDAVIAYGEVTLFTKNGESQWEFKSGCTSIAVLKHTAEGEVKEFFTLDDNGTAYYYDSDLKLIGDETAFTTWSSEGGEGYITKYTVTFMNGEGKIAEVKVSEGLTVTAPAATEVNDKIFIGWTLENDALFDLNTPINANLVLYAKYGDKVTVTFDYGYNEIVGHVDLLVNTKVTEPEKHTRDGYSFEGWFLGEEKFNFDTEITSNITLVAKWSENLSKVYTLVLTNEIYKDKTGNSYADYNGEYTVKATATDGSTLDIIIKTNQVQKKEDNFQFQASKGVINNITDLGKIKSVTCDLDTLTITYSNKLDGTYTSTVNGGYFKVAKTNKGAAYPNSITIIFEK